MKKVRCNVKQQISLPKPTLILGCGIGSSGKSTVLTEVARRVANTFWIDKDTLNESFLHNRHGSVIPGGIYSDYYHVHVKNQSYSHMLREALINVRLGKHPIVEGNYNRQIQNGYLDREVFPLFEREECVVKIVYCYAPEEIIRQRMIERGSERDLPKYQSAEKWKEVLRKQPILPLELEKYDHVKVDTSQSIDRCAEVTIEYLLR